MVVCRSVVTNANSTVVGHVWRHYENNLQTLQNRALRAISKMSRFVQSVTIRDSLQVPTLALYTRRFPRVKRIQPPTHRRSLQKWWTWGDMEAKTYCRPGFRPIVGAATIVRQVTRQQRLTCRLVLGCWPRLTSLTMSCCRWAASKPQDQRLLTDIFRSLRDSVLCPGDVERLPGTTAVPGGGILVFVESGPLGRIRPTYPTYFCAGNVILQDINNNNNIPHPWTALLTLPYFTPW